MKCAQAWARGKFRNFLGMFPDPNHAHSLLVTVQAEPGTLCADKAALCKFAVTADMSGEGEGSPPYLASLVA
jgi:hypothetical protein